MNLIPGTMLDASSASSSSDDLSPYLKSVSGNTKRPKLAGRLGDVFSLAALGGPALLELMKPSFKQDLAGALGQGIQGFGAVKGMQREADQQGRDDAQTMFSRLLAAHEEGRQSDEAARRADEFAYEKSGRIPPELVKLHGETMARGDIGDVGYREASRPSADLVRAADEAKARAEAGTILHPEQWGGLSYAEERGHKLEQGNLDLRIARADAAIKELGLDLENLKARFGSTLQLGSTAAMQEDLQTWQKIENAAAKGFDTGAEDWSPQTDPDLKRYLDLIASRFGFDKVRELLKVPEQVSGNFPDPTPDNPFGIHLSPPATFPGH